METRRRIEPVSPTCGRTFPAGYTEKRTALKGLSVLMTVFIGLIGATRSYADENASNPLAAVNNTDVRLQYFDLDGPERYDFWVADGAYMLTPKLKLKYELHYWDTDVTGSSESDWESLHLKPIYFTKQVNGVHGSTNGLLG